MNPLREKFHAAGPECFPPLYISSAVTTHLEINSATSLFNKKKTHRTHSTHFPARVFAPRNVFVRKKASHTNHQPLLVVWRLDPLLRLRCGLALPLCWRLIAVLISLFLTNLFARSTDPTAMLNERVYQLKPVVRSTRGLIFSLRNESSPRTQVSRQLETPGASKRDYWHTESW